MRRNRAIDGSGSLGMAAAFCRTVFLPGGRPNIVRTAVDFRAKRVRLLRPTNADSISHVSDGLPALALRWHREVDDGNRVRAADAKGTMQRGAPFPGITLQ